MSKEADEDWSLLDLISYHESGPVLKDRTPDVIRTPSHPEEMVYSELGDFSNLDETNIRPDEAFSAGCIVCGDGDSKDCQHKDAQHPRMLLLASFLSGKNITRAYKLQGLNKKALGLTDIPAGSPAGSQPRSHGLGPHGESDLEVSHTTGFGGPSVIDSEESNPPSNIQRKEYNKPINNSDKIESEKYFSFLQNGVLGRKRISGETRAMNTEQKELLKLAKALHLYGYTPQSNAIRKIAQEGYMENVTEWGAAGAATGAYFAGVPGMAIGAAIGASIGAWNVYSDTSTNRALAAALGEKAEAAVEAIMGIGSFFGSDPNASTIQDALGANGRTEPDFQALYLEIIRVWVEEDFSTDFHLGIIGDDAGDMSYITDFQTQMMSNVGRSITKDTAGAIISGHEDYTRFGGDAVLQAADMQRFIAAWNALAEFQSSVAIAKAEGEEEGSDEDTPSPNPPNRRGGGERAPRTSWADVQRRLNELDYPDKNGNELDTDGRWGPLTGSSWATATNDADRPGSPEAALAILADVEPREEGGGQTREKEEGEGSGDGAVEINLDEYYHHDGSNIYMKKTTPNRGSIWYLSGNTLQPIRNRGTGTVDRSTGQNHLTYREGRQLRLVLSAAVKAGEIDSAQEDAFIGMITGTRRSDAVRRPRRQRGLNQMRESQRVLNPETAAPAAE